MIFSDYPMAVKQNKILRLISIVAVVATTGCYKGELQSTQHELNNILTENNQLKNANEGLESKLQKLQDTAKYHYQKATELLSKNDLEQAKNELQTVITKYPSDNLVMSAKELLLNTENKIAIEIAKKKDAEQQAEKERQMEIAGSGDSIDYASFYAKATMGLPVGKRFRFRAYLSTTPSLRASYREFGQTIQNINLNNFDSPSEYEAWLKTGQDYNGTIVAGMTSSGQIAIFRLH